MKTSEPPIIVENTLNANIEDVWSIITEKDHMIKWFFDTIPAFEAKVGFETRFDINTGKRVFPHLWKIIEVEAPRKISYNWKYENYQGDSNVYFELFSENQQTKIRLTAVVIEDFSDDIPEFSRESAVGGWNYFIGERLPKYIDTIDSI